MGGVRAVGLHVQLLGDFQRGVELLGAGGGSEETF